MQSLDSLQPLVHRHQGDRSACAGALSGPHHRPPHGLGERDSTLPRGGKSTTLPTAKTASFQTQRNERFLSLGPYVAHHGAPRLHSALESTPVPTHALVRVTLPQTHTMK